MSHKAMNDTPANPERSRRIGLIGLGLVGAAIAENLIAAGCEIIGFDTDPERCENLRSLGGSPVNSPAQAANRLDCVILSLPDSTIVKQVVEGPNGILTAASPPKYIIDTTTGDPDDTIALAARLKKRNIHILDATISGSSQQLRERRAVMIVGADPQAWDACCDLLAVLSDRIFHMGPPGSGAKAKLASNLIIGLNRLALAEGLVFAEKLGLDPADFLDLLKITPAYSAVMDTKGQKMLDADFAPQARLRQHRKDVALILKHAKTTHQSLPLSEKHIKLLDSAIAAGDGDLDNCAVIRELRRQSQG